MINKAEREASSVKRSESEHWFGVISTRYTLNSVLIYSNHSTRQYWLELLCISFMVNTFKLNLFLCIWTLTFNLCVSFCSILYHSSFCMPCECFLSVVWLEVRAGYHFSLSLHVWLFTYMITISGPLKRDICLSLVWVVTASVERLENALGYYWSQIFNNPMQKWRLLLFSQTNQHC